VWRWWALIHFAQNKDERCVLMNMVEHVLLYVVLAVLKRDALLCIFRHWSVLAIQKQRRNSCSAFNVSPKIFRLSHLAF
jgi:hypothetical protein